MEAKHKFLTLDALRGVAALAVAQYHTAGLFRPSLFRHGYLAVDFFFMLSGFVLTFAYQKRLDEGWSGWLFLKNRIVRLYPLYLLGLLVGFAVYLLPIYAAGHRPSHGVMALFVLSLVMIPNMPFMGGHAGPLFLFDFPMWSLFFEVVANVLHAWFGRRRSTLVLALVTVIAGLALIPPLRMFGVMGFGYLSPQIWWGLPRVIFSYTFGMILFRVWRSGAFRWKVPPAAAALLLLAVLAVPTRGVATAIYDLVAVVCLFPVLLLLSAASMPGRRLAPAAKWLGIASYALYVLHSPVLELLKVLWPHLRSREISLDQPWSEGVYFVLLIALSLCLDAAYDLPARAFLRRRLLQG